MPLANPPDDSFRLSAADQQVLDGMAGKLEEEDPVLAAKLGGEEPSKMSTPGKLIIVLALVLLFLAILAAMSHMVLYGSPATEYEENQAPVVISTATPFSPLSSGQ